MKHSIELGGIPGRKFIFDHSDEPFVLRTASYVAENRGKFLGLEFRANDELNEVE